MMKDEYVAEVVFRTPDAGFQLLCNVPTTSMVQHSTFSKFMQRSCFTSSLPCEPLTTKSVPIVINNGQLSTQYIISTLLLAPLQTNPELGQDDECDGEEHGWDCGWSVWRAGRCRALAVGCFMVHVHVIPNLFLFVP